MMFGGLLWFRIVAAGEQVGKSRTAEEQFTKALENIGEEGLTKEHFRAMRETLGFDVTEPPEDKGMELIKAVVEQKGKPVIDFLVPKNRKWEQKNPERHKAYMKTCMREYRKRKKEGE